MQIGEIYIIPEINSDGSINNDKIDYVVAMFQHNYHTHCLNITKVINPEFIGWDRQGTVIDDDHPAYKANMALFDYKGSQIIPKVFTWRKD